MFYVCVAEIPTEETAPICELQAYLWCFGALSISGIFYVGYIQEVGIL